MEIDVDMKNCHDNVDIGTSIDIDIDIDIGIDIDTYACIYR